MNEGKVKVLIGLTFVYLFTFVRLYIALVDFADSLLVNVLCL